MAPLPANNTAVYFVDYSYQDQSHTIQFRTDDATPAGIVAEVSNFLTELTPLMDNTWAILGARFRADGGVISLPATAPTLGAPAAGGTVNAYRKPREITFLGRGSVTGRRVKIAVFGLNPADSGDFRYQDGEIAALDAARAILNSGTSGQFLTIGGDLASWYEYCSVDWNSYWERKARG